MEEFIPFAQTIFEAVISGQWWLAVATLFAALALVVRRFPDKLPASLGTVPGVILLTFGLSFGGGLANALAAGAAFSWEVIRTALSIGGAAVGGWAALETLARYFFPQLFPPKDEA